MARSGIKSVARGLEKQGQLRNLGQKDRKGLVGAGVG